MKKSLIAKLFSGFVLIIIATLFVFYFRSGDKISEPDSPIYRRHTAKSAKIKIFEHSDFACPACAFSHKQLKEIMKIYEGRIDLNYKYYPLTIIHPYSMDASLYAECAGKQGKFWELADLLFENQEKWARNEKYREVFDGFVSSLKLDKTQFEQCLKDPQVLKDIKMDISYGDLMGVDATPTFFVNGKRAVGFRQLLEIFKKEASAL